MTSKAIHIPVAQERAFWIAVAILGLLAFSYCFLVRATIVAAVDGQNMRNQVSSVGITLANLGEEYLTQTNALTLAKANSLGLTQVSDVTYVTRVQNETSAGALSYNGR